MRLKKTRHERVCHYCKATIAKGDQYGIKSIELGGKATQAERDAVAPAILIESIRVSRPVCANCAN